MTPFSAKLRDGGSFLGLGLSEADFLRLKGGAPVIVDLGSIGVGLWHKDADGKRSFLQPRDSKIVLIPGDTREDIGEFLRVDLP
jgi:hypothetical protein